MIILFYSRKLGAQCTVHYAANTTKKLLESKHRSNVLKWHYDSDEEHKSRRWRRQVEAATATTLFEDEDMIQVEAEADIDVKEMDEDFL